jgi:hypothetical protein
MKLVFGIILAAAILSGCQGPETLPLSGGVQTLVVTPAGELARLPRQPLVIKELDGTEQEITTDENGLAAFPLVGPETEYLILTGPQAWRGVAQVVVYVIYQWMPAGLKAVEVKHEG